MSRGAVPYAGGTELLLAMRSGLLAPEALVNLKPLVELSSIAEQADGGLTIGGCATHQAVVRHPAVRKRFPLLVEVLSRVGNPRVRATGTLGGNLCFGEPKSDVATLLIALEADVTMQEISARRSLPVREFSVGPYTTTRNESEILTSISIPPLGERQVAYEKHQTMERPTVGVAGSSNRDGTVRIVVGAVGPAPEVFELADLNDANASEIAAAVEVIPDLTGSERYKRHMTIRTIKQVIERLRHES